MWVVWLGWLLSSLDFSQLPGREPVVVAIHCLFGANQRVEVENPAITEGQFQFHAVLQNTLEIADAQNFPEAIHNAQISLEIKIFQARTLLGRQRERQIWLGTMRRMQIRERRLDLHKVCLAEPAADVHVACD